ncbi:hypothetical protein PV682_37920 [Streptomyces niveiscabiei]|uniref:hypothetical protein n=1 Tax=Streptomyces niveiscabiei TaxID=164115 RepID=UPI0029A847C2|nr:hypothetical protein [Streptomyces niveiscabiei]MDX3387181.1 hypothetical protein [Streptomyces niveiscabiei]
MYPGTSVTCVHNPDRAFCRSPEASPDQPVMADYQPLARRNTALTTANRQALAGHLTQLEGALDNGDRLAPYVRRLRQENADLRRDPRPV